MEIIANNKVDRLIEIYNELTGIGSLEAWQDKCYEGLLECESIVRKNHSEETYQACIRFHEMFITDLVGLSEELLDMEVSFKVDMIDAILEIIWID